MRAMVVSVFGTRMFRCSIVWSVRSQHNRKRVSTIGRKQYLHICGIDGRSRCARDIPRNSLMRACCPRQSRIGLRHCKRPALASHVEDHLVGADASAARSIVARGHVKFHRARDCRQNLSGQVGVCPDGV